MAARGKTIALWSAGLGVIVLLGGAVALREQLLEEWHIHKLRTGDPEEARRAAEALGRMGSVRAVPALLEAACRSQGDLSADTGAQYSMKVRRLSPLGDAGLGSRLPFPLTAGSDWETPLSAIALERSGYRILFEAGTGAVIASWGESPASAEAVRWASAAIDQIGEPAVPALERAAADESLDPGTRAFATFELARRALANPRIVLEGESAEVSVEQRTSAPLPGSQGSVYLSADDITGGRVKVWVTPSAGAPLIKKHPLAEGEEVSFSLAGKTYLLRLEDLRNRLIGTDHAVFTIREVRAK